GGAVRRRRLRPRPNRASRRARRVEWRTRLHVPDLLRLLGLLGHGGGSLAAVRNPPATQLCVAVQGHEHRRLLDALAHFSLSVPSRLSLYPAGRQRERKLASL